VDAAHEALTAVPTAALCLLGVVLAQVMGASARRPEPRRRRAGPAVVVVRPRLPTHRRRGPPGVGEVITFPFDDARLLSPEHRDAGGVWVSPNARPGDRLPLFIYLHGLNRAGILRRWLHTSHWDLRAIVGPLAASGRVGPMAVAVPATTGAGATDPRTIYRGFDPGAFVEAADAALAARGFRVDRSRVILSAHSASGCVRGNGLFQGVGDAAVQTLLDIDCCMDESSARALGAAPPGQRVIVAYQDAMWNDGRHYDSFRRVFRRFAAAVSEPSQRVIERYVMRGVDAHNDMVPVVLRRWLPRLVPPRALARPTADVAR
jgi:hypothetical protein